jgi:hypothetical protein
MVWVAVDAMGSSDEKNGSNYLKLHVELCVEKVESS